MHQRLLLTVIVFILGFCGITVASGGYLPGQGKIDNPYLIEDIADFLVFANIDNAETYWASEVYTQLTVPLDLSDTIYPTALIAGDSDPLDYSFVGTQYSGNFDGKFQPISGLTIQATDGIDYLGLFGFAQDAMILNVVLVNTSITSADGSMYAGTLCGYTLQCDIENCATETNINLAAACDYAGGMVGYDDQTKIFNSFTTGDIQSQGNDVGGFCGYSNGDISNCYAQSNAHGGGNVGGFCGHKDGGKIEYCYSTGKPDGSEQTGGFCAINNGTINGCFWDTTTSQTTDSDGGDGMETADMYISSNYEKAGWLFIDLGPWGLWRMPYQTGYPILSYERDIPADVTGRYGVDFEDFLLFSQSWQTQTGDAMFNPACDLEKIATGDQIVIQDIAILFNHWLAGI